MKYGMNLLLWTGHVTETHFPLFGKLRKVGYDGVEIPIFEGDEKHYAAIKKELDKQGLKSTTVTVMNEQTNPISPDAKIRRAALDRLKKVIDHPAVKMMYDTFHANLEEKNPPKALAEVAKQVIHIHISENDRGTPGTGHVQWAETFAQLKKM